MEGWQAAPASALILTGNTWRSVALFSPSPSRRTGSGKSGTGEAGGVNLHTQLGGGELGLFAIPQGPVMGGAHLWDHPSIKADKRRRALAITLKVLKDKARPPQGSGSQLLRCHVGQGAGKVSARSQLVLWVSQPQMLRHFCPLLWDQRQVPFFTGLFCG